MELPPPPTVLGLDVSTTALKAHVYDVLNDDTKCHLILAHATAVNFDHDLPKYGTNGGVIRMGNRVVIPTAMLLDAIDLAFSRLPRDLLARCVAIGGGAQQHSTCLWNDMAENALSQLHDASTKISSLCDCLCMALATPNGASWQDASTSNIIQMLDRNVPHARAITGSRPTARFSGPQVAVLDSQIFINTNRIQLCSTFITSVLTGMLNVKPDLSDSCGMNVLDLQSCQWSLPMIDGLVNAGIAFSWPQLAVDEATRHFIHVLGPPPELLHSPSVLPLASYFTHRYGFSSQTMVTGLTGDNIALAYGLGLQDGAMYLSFGTSDTVGIITRRRRERPTTEDDTSHIFLLPGGELELVLICFTNGSIARKIVCDRSCNGDWAVLDDISSRLGTDVSHDTPIVSLICSVPETTPEIFNGGVQIYSQAAATDFIIERPIPTHHPNARDDVRSILETRIAQMYNHFQRVQRLSGAPARLVICGGATRNSSVVRIVSEIFCGTPVHVAENDVEAVALGGAVRAVLFNATTNVSVELQSRQSPLLCPVTRQRLDYNAKLCNAVALAEEQLKNAHGNSV